MKKELLSVVYRLLNWKVLLLGMIIFMIEHFIYAALCSTLMNCAALCFYKIFLLNIRF